MSAVPATPLTKPSFEPTTPPAQRHERPGTHVQASSPHYPTTRRHSLYGTEDRIILDPGSCVWKVGFSGEGRPRDVFAVGSEGGGLWRLSSTSSFPARDEEDRQLEGKMHHYLRSIFHEYVCLGPAVSFF